MKAADLKKKINVKGVKLVDPARHGATVITYLDNYELSVLDVIKGLEIIEDQLTTLEEAKAGMEELINANT